MNTLGFHKAYTSSSAFFTVGLWRRLSTKELRLLNSGVWEDSWESVPWAARSNKSILKEISPRCSLEGLMLKLKLQYFCHLMRRVDSLEKTLMLGGIGQEEKGMTEDEMAVWHHRLDGHEFEWTPGIADIQGGLECCNSWGRKELDTTKSRTCNELELNRIFLEITRMKYFPETQ